MPADTFARGVELSANQDTCWKVLTDVEKLVRWISVLSDAQEIEYLSRYTAVLTDRLGPFSLKAELDISVTEVRDGTLIALEAEGRDRHVDSRIFVAGQLHLDPLDRGCRLQVDGKYEVTGRVATFGTPMIRAKADSIIDDFFKGIESELG